MRNGPSTLAFRGFEEQGSIHEQLFLFVGPAVPVDDVNPADVGLLAILAACFGGAAVLAMAEVSIIRVRRAEVLAAAESGGTQARQLLNLIDNLPLVLNTILLAVLLCQLTAATVSGFLASRWFGGFGVTAATFITTAALFVYAEAIPKTKAMRAPQEVALRLTPFLRILVRITRPIVVALVWLAGLQTSGTADFGSASEHEIRELARQSADAGAIDHRDAELVNRSFEFNDRHVADVMVPRSQMAGINHEQLAADALDRAISLGHRRLIVYRSGLDDIVGMVKLRHLAAAAQTPAATVSSIVSDVLRCRPEQPIAQLLDQMQRSGLWLAVITDPDGRTLGLATVEDLVAELVGEIEDEGPDRLSDLTEEPR